MDLIETIDPLPKRFKDEEPGKLKGRISLLKERTSFGLLLELLSTYLIKQGSLV